MQGKEAERETFSGTPGEGHGKIFQSLRKVAREKRKTCGSFRRKVCLELKGEAMGGKLIESSKRSSGKGKKEKRQGSERGRSRSHTKTVGGHLGGKA